MPKLRVELNGTDTNPFHKMGLTCNPFPQITKYELMGPQRKLAKLAADPIPHDRYKEYIAETLKDFSPEFIKLCQEQFVPGKIVKFFVHWRD